ncbi:MAG: hypothetical protein N2203_08050, partial [Bacteroidia bacterium]|nr:hypothetical protein [Bacteroidia bacterium]
MPKKFHSGLLSFEIIWLILVFSISGLLLFYQPHQWSDAFRVILSLILIIQVSKLFGVIFMLLDDIRRLIVFVFNYSKNMVASSDSTSTP